MPTGTVGIKSGTKPSGASSGGTRGKRDCQGRQVMKDVLSRRSGVVSGLRLTAGILRPAAVLAADKPVMATLPSVATMLRRQWGRLRCRTAGQYATICS
jgi:hypothetical protein